MADKERFESLAGIEQDVQITVPTHKPGHLNMPRLLSVPSRKHNDPARYSQFAALVIISISYETAAPFSPRKRFTE